MAGRSHEHGVVGEVPAHDRSGADDGVAAEVGPWQHDGSGAEPRAVADHDGVIGRPLLPDRHLRVGVHVVLVGDVAVRARHDVVADHDRTVGDDVARPTDRAAANRSGAPGWWHREATAARGPCPPRGSRGRRAAWPHRGRCAPRRTRRRAGTPAGCRRRSGGTVAPPGPAAPPHRPTAARATGDGWRPPPRRATSRTGSRLDG